MRRWFQLFVVPHATFLIIFIFGFWVLQSEWRQIKAIQAQACEDRHRVYALLASGMRRRAVYADAYVTPSHDRPYGRELRREAAEIEAIARASSACTKP